MITRYYRTNFLLLGLIAFCLLVAGTVSTGHAQSTGNDLCIDDFEDTNRNGQRDGNEQSLPGVGVFLQQGETVIASLTTTPDEDCFRSLAAGDYTIRFQAPDGYEAVTSTEFPVVLQEQRQQLNFGAVPVGNTGGSLGNQICVLVFFDENTNGRRESTEALLGGIDINLEQSDLIVQTGVSSVSDAICFENLQAEQYRIFIPPSPNHIMVNRRDATIQFTDLGTQVNAPFGARPVNPLSDDAVIEVEDEGGVRLEGQERLLLAGLGAGVVVLFMLGLGIILYAIIRG